MRENKAVKLLYVCMVCILSAGTAACGKGEAKPEKHTVSEAKMDSYESAEELQANAAVVLRVKKTDQEENVAEQIGESGFSDGYTKSLVEVKEIMKNISHQPIAVGDNIPILENQFTYKEKDGTKVTCHVSRYKKMEPGNEYFLFLNYSQHNEWFYILSGLFGKVPVSAEEALLYPASEITLYDGQPYEEDQQLDEIMEKIRAGSLALYP